VDRIREEVRMMVKESRMESALSTVEILGLIPLK
jgi:hypothetical protein